MQKITELTELGFSEAVVVNDTIYTSGQVGIDLKTNKFVTNEVAGQAKQTLSNIEALLKEVGSDKNQIVKMTVLLTSIDDFEKVNTVYKEFFGDSFPARTTCVVKELPGGALVEMDCIAIKK